jgi:hypothetical protein
MVNYARGLLIEKVEKHFDVFSELFSGLGGRAKDLVMP